MPTRNEPLPPADEGPVERPLGMEPERARVARSTSASDSAAYATEHLAQWLDAQFGRSCAFENAAAADRLRDQHADIRVLEAAVEVVSRALDNLVDACMGADGKPQAPERGALMRARAMLPPRCKHALKKPNAGGEAHAHERN